jgi:hypothetical protein
MTADGDKLLLPPPHGFRDRSARDFRHVAIDHRGEFIEDEQLRLFSQGPRDRHAKLLSIADKVAKELAIADNRAAELNLSWDPEVLAELGAEIDLTPFFSTNELGKATASGGGAVASGWATIHVENRRIRCEVSRRAV